MHPSVCISFNSLSLAAFSIFTKSVWVFKRWNFLNVLIPINRPRFLLSTIFPFSIWANRRMKRTEYLIKQSSMSQNDVGRYGSLYFKILTLERSKMVCSHCFRSVCWSKCGKSSGPPTAQTSTRVYCAMQSYQLITVKFGLETVN